MRYRILPWLFALLSVPLMSTAANAWERGFTTTTVNLRAGPSTGYPVVVAVRGGSPVTVYGCEARRQWCDVGWSNIRGWMYGKYIYVDYRGTGQTLTPSLIPLIGLGIVAFDQGYWNRYYRGYPWYGNWNRYYRPPARPRPPYYGPRPRPPYYGPGPRPPYYGPRPRTPYVGPAPRPPYGSPRPPYAGPYPRPPHAGLPRGPRPPRGVWPRYRHPGPDDWRNVPGR